jgi:hypothetical protein
VSGEVADVVADHIPGPGLDPALLAVLRVQVADTAERTVAAVVSEVPEYAGAFDGEYRTGLEGAVRMALGGFVSVLANVGGEVGSPQGALRGAYALGRGEALAGRSVDSLLAAYRVGTRVHWQDLSRTAIEHDVPAPAVADLAAMMFAYNDELSAASVAGHADQIAAAGRLLDLQRERLARGLLAGEPADTLTARARRANWTAPTTLTVVLIPPTQAHLVTGLGPGTLILPADADLPHPHDETVLLVPDAHTSRPALMRALAGRSAVVGPARPWTLAAGSYHRAVRALTLPRPGDRAPLDTEAHLAALVVAADPDALHDLQTTALAPLAGLPEDTADRLAQTLRSWLLHQGRREHVATDLHIHPQTVRYRMDQVRDLFGDQLTDPDQVLTLTIALAHPHNRDPITG